MVEVGTAGDKTHLAGNSVVHNNCWTESLSSSLTLDGSRPAAYWLRLGLVLDRDWIVMQEATNILLHLRQSRWVYSVGKCRLRKFEKPICLLSEDFYCTPAAWSYCLYPFQIISYTCNYRYYSRTLRLQSQCGRLQITMRCVQDGNLYETCRRLTQTGGVLQLTRWRRRVDDNYYYYRLWL